MRKVYVILIILLSLLFGAFIFVKINAPIKIALIGDFIDEKNSFQTTSIVSARIAQDEINKSGGILGKQVKIIIKQSDLSDIEGMLKELSKERVELVISTFSSENLKKLQPYLDKYNIVCLSANATSTSMSKTIDNVYKLLPDDTKEVERLMKYLKDNKISPNFQVVYDVLNKEYVKSVEQELASQGGTILNKRPWDENYDLDNKELSKGMDANNPILIVTSSTDTAFIIQKLKYQGINNDNFIGFSWNGDFNVIKYGGRAVEGFKVVTPIDINPYSERYKNLNEKLKEYGKSNSMVVSTVYEAIMISRQIYDYHIKTHTSIKETLQNNREYNLWGSEKVVFDNYGDSQREEHVFKVSNGNFHMLEGK